MKKVKKIIVREAQYFFFTLILIGAGALPFLTDHFSNEPQTMVAQNLSNDNITILNEEKIMIEQVQLSQSSLFDLSRESRTAEDHHTRGLHFIYFAYVFLILFFVYPVRYNLYVLNYLLN
ncbi:hypothetical protein [Flammeovirga sp. SJP92]|uniref:hypothetical protein n=1 Tax=Flammeovirga sp. SJP92 TaxID=1775430 RepID=UPI0007893225|nr:hypothetical protein [Flammeovirga sp. SJP92]KXX70270.1 hypothetical protein AVL50_11735 [Flammeovirga sp. SJP92]